MTYRRVARFDEAQVRLRDLARIAGSAEHQEPGDSIVDVVLVAAVMEAGLHEERHALQPSRDRGRVATCEGDLVSHLLTRVRLGIEADQPRQETPGVVEAPLAQEPGHSRFAAEDRQCRDRMRETFLDTCDRCLIGRYTCATDALEPGQVGRREQRPAEPPRPAGRPHAYSLAGHRFTDASQQVQLDRAKVQRLDVSLGIICLRRHLHRFLGESESRGRVPATVVEGRLRAEGTSPFRARRRPGVLRASRIASCSSIVSSLVRGHRAKVA